MIEGVGIEVVVEVRAERITGLVDTIHMGVNNIIVMIITLLDIVVTAERDIEIDIGRIGPQGQGKIDIRIQDVNEFLQNAQGLIGHRLRLHLRDHPQDLTVTRRQEQKEVSQDRAEVSLNPKQIVRLYATDYGNSVRQRGMLYVP